VVGASVGGVVGLGVGVAVAHADSTNVAMKKRLKATETRSLRNIFLLLSYSFCENLMRSFQEYEKDRCIWNEKVVLQKMIISISSPDNHLPTFYSS
jgi:hypothetical protein